jgi:hypothetical protein
MNINKFILLIFYFSLIIIGCNKPYQFNIKLHDDYDYKEIHNLINEIYDNAKNKNVEYFMKVKDFESNIFEFSRDFLDVLKIQFNKLECSDKEIIEYYYTLEINSIMDMIVRSKLNKNYKKYAYIAKDGIDFNFHLDPPEIHYHIYISKDDNRNWVLTYIFLSR